MKQVGVEGYVKDQVHYLEAPEHADERVRRVSKQWYFGAREARL